ncbi:HD domain-containing phosphohydrolase [Desulfovibrio ferrophilus]|uniref:Response regulatory domain-containing protein n=1 Tax=Desulfovibrio ferrophilus TaxID=241368 RepID=A0A2Z6AWU9_9BACT|nr:HD domain-containing phosphohydrolase [Desulfovibrio ferrophilus]BBD07673.1 uncharacterized protein DFE_0947 [Desulfovibrio ferrophilus]
MAIQKILLVDDEPANIKILHDILKDSYELSAATSGDAALEGILGGNIPDLVLLDIVMPGKDGYEVCEALHANAKTRKIPVIFVTSRNDIDDETKGFAVGGVDYITKPVTPAIVRARVNAHLQLKKARSSLNELLHQTFGGSIRMMTDILSLTNPMAFSRASRIRQLMAELVAALNIKERMAFDLAAQLSQLGCLMLPEALLSKAERGEPLSPEEQAMYADHPAMARDLLAHLPRLEKVAEMIVRQHEPFGNEGDWPTPRKRDHVDLGAHLLRLVGDYDRLVMGMGAREEVALRQMRDDTGQYDPRLVNLLQCVLEVSALELAVKTISADELLAGMILDEDVHSDDGVLLATEGMEISDSVYKILSRYRAHGHLNKHFRVLIPGTSTGALECEGAGLEEE